MKGTFRSVGLSYKNAPIELREMVALTEPETQNILHFIKDQQLCEEVLIISTCNRTEFHYFSEQDLSEIFIKLLLIEKGISFDPSFKQHFELREGQDAIIYLYRVSLGLEAQVLGDMQIINQVKRAYQWSADLELAGAYLHRLMHAIFFTNKRVVQETPFRDGAASVSYAAAELVEELTINIAKPNILVVGLGEIGADVVRNLVKLDTDNVWICNRTKSVAEELAAECGFKVLPFENLDKGIRDAHVVVSSVSTSTPLITADLVNTAGGIETFKFFIDLSVPRSISKEISIIPGSFVYNIDQIREKVTEVQQLRLKAIPTVELMALEAVEEFNDWSREMQVSPTIHKIKDALEAIRQEELGRYLKNASEKEAEIIDKVTKSLMQKIIKLPVLQLKAACRRGDAKNLMEVLNELFDLEKEKAKEEN
jgi:glutamyl-tRNA reductase